MRNEFQLESGSGNAKYFVLGAIALAFAAGAYALIGKDSPPPAPHVAAAPEAAPPPAAAPAPIADAGAAAPSPAAPVAMADTAADAALPAAGAMPAAASAAAPASASSVAMAEPSMPASDDMYAGAQPDSLDDVAPPADDVSRDEDKSRSAVRKPPPPAVDSLDAWWRSTSPNGFTVQYVGQAAAQPALVIRLSQGVAQAANAMQHIQLFAENGTPVSGSWQSAANGFVLLHDNLTPGRYTLKIDAALASASGKTLPRSVSGPVYIE